MSFAVEASSKALKAAGISHIITAGGYIITENPEIVEAYDPKAMVGTPISVKKGKKNGKTVWIAVINQKKKIPAKTAAKIRASLKRAAGWVPKPTGKHYPKRAKAIKNAHKNPKNFVRDAKKSSGKKAAKKVVKKAAPAKKAGKRSKI